jgi:tetratricopeptide (TPR) repeat protein
MKLLAKEPNDSIRVRLLQLIGITWNGRNPNKAHQYYDQGISLAQKINDKSLMAGVMTSKGYLYSGTGQNVQAIRVLQEAIRLKEGRNKPTIANCQCFIALSFQNLGDLENALRYAQLCYDYYYSEHKKYGISQQSGMNSLMEGITGSTMNLGEVYLNRGQLDSAYRHLNKAYELFKFTNRNRYFTFHIPELLGRLHLKRKQFKSAKQYFDEALRNATLYADTVGLALSWSEMATYYVQTNRLDSAVLYAQKAIDVGLKIKRFEAVVQSCRLLKTYYTQQNNPAKALYYSNLMDVVQDNLSNAEKVKQSQRLLFEEQQNQQALAQLEADNQNRLIRYGLGAGVVLLLLVAIILWLNYDRKQRENQNLDAKIKLQETEFAHKLAETEMTALRAQMNPHFIFNCLNSIKLYTLENDNLKATEYMTKFSRLIRLVLENSRSERITLAKELETLQLYMDMEAMRFKDKVAYQINVADEIDTHYIEIPPLLIQPYIENAIWHGLMHKEGGGLITISVDTRHALYPPVETILQITITDNGIGRKAAAELKSKSATSNKSFGLKMTSERIELINQLYQTQTQVTIEDLDVGTKVTIEIPI